MSFKADVVASTSRILEISAVWVSGVGLRDTTSRSRIDALLVASCSRTRGFNCRFVCNRLSWNGCFGKKSRSPPEAELIAGMRILDQLLTISRGAVQETASQSRALDKASSRVFVSKAGTLDFDKLSAFNGKPGVVHVVIETEKGSRNKLAYDQELGLFRLKKVLPQGM